MENKTRTESKRKYPAPQVRQTVASMIRLVRANPLILETNTGTKDCTAEELRRKLPTSIRERPFGLQSNHMTNDFAKIVKGTLIFGRPSIPILKTKALQKKTADIFPTKEKSMTNVAKTDGFRKPQFPLPASTKKNSRPALAPVLKRKSFSADDIPTAVLGVMNCTATQSIDYLNAISPINSSKIKTLRKSTKICNSTPKYAKTPSLIELNARLNNWLQRRQKLPITLKYLQSIQDQKITIEKLTVVEELATKHNLVLDDKENTTSALNIKTDKNYVNNFDVLVETLKELKQLIQEGYDPEHCGFWLKKIKEKYVHLEEIPQFWECKAALEQAGDNVNEAIECYKTAIIYGAEVQEIDESLEKLFQKFGTLNLGDPINYFTDTKANLKNSNIICNQFKSSIIQFAILQMKMKKTHNHKLTSVITPVRRSSRLSHIRTPNLRVSSTIEELTEDSEIKFRTNDHLSVRYN